MVQEIKIRNVGNSTVVTIPNSVLESSSTNVGDVVEVKNFGKECFLISPRKAKKKLRGELIMEQFYGKPIEEIGIVNEAEEVWKDKKPVGEEVW